MPFKFLRKIRISLSHPKKLDGSDGGFSSLRIPFSGHVNGIQYTFQSFFAYPAGSLVKTFVMMVGELEYEALFPHDAAESPPPFEYYSNLLFVVFVLVMGIVVMNLLVGLAVDDIQEIQENAELHQLSLNVSGKYVHPTLLNLTTRWSWCLTWNDSFPPSASASPRLSLSTTPSRSSS